MQKRKATSNLGPNLPKLRTAEEEEKHGCLQGGRNCSTSQQSARTVSTTLPSQQHPTKKQMPKIAAPNLPKLRTAEEEKKHGCFEGGRNCSTSQQSARKVSITLPSQQHPTKKQMPTISAPNLSKLRSAEEEKKHGCFQGGRNCSTSQQSARKVSTAVPSQQHPTKKQKPSITETGQSSGSRLFCKICMETKRPTEIFTIKQCGHAFCSECISQHVAAKIQENSPSVQCPEPSCKVVLEPILLQPILPPDVFDRWGSVMCESLIQESMKFYCPFKDCSGLLVDERKKDGVLILESECPHCNRLFCAKCKVPWHSGISCDNFQKLGKHERDREDIMLMNLAKIKKWQRCPQCGFYVERIEGCLFMKCRCSYCFCYHCAGPSDPKYHYCQRCKR